MARESPSTPTASRPFHVMTKPTGPSCNLECEYCFYLDKKELYPERATYDMTEETLEEFVRQYIEAQPGPVVTFAWQGGEPTLRGLDFYRTVVEFQEKHTNPEKRVKNTIQTNGTRLDDEWCMFFAEHDFLVGISIDGPRELHNRFRKTRADGPTFKTAMNGLSLLDEHDVEHNVLCVVNAINSRQPLDVYEFFTRQGVEWIQFIPLVEPLEPSTDETDGKCGDEGAGGREGTLGHQIPEWVRERGGCVERDDDYANVVRAARAGPVTDRSVDPAVYGEFMCEIFDEWIRNDVGKVSVRLFDQCLETLLQGESNLCVYRETCGSQVAMEHNGDVYACDHFVDLGFERGNIHETHLADIVDDPDQVQFGEYKRDGLPSRCRNCPVREFCHGGCPKNWHLETPDGEPGLNYLCAGYRRFFTYVQPYLNLVERTVDDGLPLPLVTEAVTTLDDRGEAGTTNTL